jgi:hypothetical protein
MINWQYYPKSDSIPEHLVPLIEIFKLHELTIKSPENKLSSNQVLSILHKDLLDLKFDVERSKSAENKLKVPVLFGKNGRLEKYFEADSFHKDTGTVLEVEAGRGVTNYQFLKDLFQACMMHSIYYLVIAVRNKYRSSPDFDKVVAFFDTLYVSGRLRLPLKGILIIGY